MLAAVEDKDVVVAVDPDAADLLEGPAGRQFRPVLHRFVCVRAVANGSHARAPLSIAAGKACHEAKGSSSQVWQPANSSRGSFRRRMTRYYGFRQRERGDGES